MQKRYVSLDVLRGLTIACMVMVNNPGSYEFRYAQLCHTAWAGCTVCDLVFPFFLFCAGVAMAFSLAKYTTFSAEGIKKVIRRGALIFLVGLALNMFPFVPINPHDPQATFGQNWIYWLQHVRIFGVLQRIGLCYIVGGLLALWLKAPMKLAIGVATLTLAHWAILYFFGAHPGWDTLEGNISGPLDIALIGESHVFHGYGIPFDPEGLLGVISGTGTLLLGYLAGYIVRNAESPIKACADVFAFSALCLAIGCIWDPWLPISKPLWSGSYVFYTAGWALFVLAFLIYCIDVRGWGKPFTPLKIMGMNPLAIFVTTGLIVRIFGRIITWHPADAEGGATTGPATTNILRCYYESCCVPLFGDNAFASLFYALTFVALMFLFALFLYRRKIVIRL